MAIFPITNVPRTIPGLKIWFDASYTPSIIQSGGFVSQWNDLSSNRISLLQTTGAAQPVYNINSYNGKNGVYFDGSTTYMTTVSSVSSVILGTTPFCFYWVARKNTDAGAGGDNWVVGLLPTTSTGYGYTGDSFQARGSATTYLLSHVYTAPGISGTPAILGATFSPNPVTTMTAYQSNSQVGQLTTITETICSTAHIMCMGARADGTAKSRVEIFELIAYRAPVSSDDQLRLYRYFANKYGIT